MERLVTTEVSLDSDEPTADARAGRVFNASMIVSGIRCALAYVILPFVTPLLGLAPGVGPLLGIAVGSVAIGANVWSMRRFWVLGHRWKKPVTAIHLGVIALLLVLIAFDLAELLG